MAEIDRAKEELEHMESRTQWHASHQRRVKALRDAVGEAEKGAPLTEEEKKENEVHHQH